MDGANLRCGSLFGPPNLERQLGIDDAAGTLGFGASQIDMNFQWQIIEELAPGRTDVRLRNYRHWLDESGVDLRSSVHMIFDVFDQLIDVIIFALEILDLCKINHHYISRSIQRLLYHTLRCSAKSARIANNCAGSKIPQCDCGKLCNWKTTCVIRWVLFAVWSFALNTFCTLWENFCLETVKFPQLLIMLFYHFRVVLCSFVCLSMVN